MARYRKDDINFHGFVRVTRRLQNKTQERVTNGLYSISMSHRIERGKRLPRKLERDRMVARLGVSGEGYEDYLVMTEYEQWVMRQEILKSIEDRDIEKLEQLLIELRDEYASMDDISNVELQYFETMNYQLLKLKGAPGEELRRSIEKAVAYTIPDIENGFPEELLLADQEINLLIEYVSLHSYGVTVEECRKWRLKRYEDILGYIDQSSIDVIGKTKIYPKIVCYICKERINEKHTYEEALDNLEICNDAIELLRDNRKMFYLMELLEVRQEMIAELIELGEDPHENYLRNLMKTSEKWIATLRDIYTEYDVSPYMENFADLYRETDSYCLNEVLRIRRKMLHMTQEEFAKGICSSRTVRRIEKKQIKPQIHEVRGLLGKAGLCPEYVRANVITTDVKVMELHIKLNQCLNDHEYDMAEQYLTELGCSLCQDIIQNRQIVREKRNQLSLYTHKKTVQQYAESAKEILGLTMPIDTAFMHKEWYLTDAEISCLSAVAIYTNEGNNPYMDRLVRYCEEEIAMNRISSRVRVNEFLFTNIANILGSRGEYEKSNCFSETIMKYSLRNRRMPTLPQNIYNKLWNEFQPIIEPSKVDVEHYNATLYKCINLCEIAKLDKMKQFFEVKIKN